MQKNIGVKIAYLIVEFDAHTERVDQYRQQNATREITMIDKTLHILTETLPLHCKTDTQLQQNCTVYTHTSSLVRISKSKGKGKPYLYSALLCAAHL